MRTRGLRAALLALLAMCVLVWPSPAGAHSELVSSEPGANTAVAELDRIVLRFASEVRTDGAHLLLSDGMQPVLLQDVSHPDGDTKVIEAAIPALLDGTYTLMWHVLAADGDSINGEFRFDVTSAAAVAAGATGGADANDTPTPAEEGADGGLPVSLLAAVGTVLLAAVVAIRHRRRGSTITGRAPPRSPRHIDRRGRRPVGRRPDARPARRERTPAGANRPTPHKERTTS